MPAAALVRCCAPREPGAPVEAEDEAEAEVEVEVEGAGGPVGVTVVPDVAAPGRRPGGAPASPPGLPVDDPVHTLWTHRAPGDARDGRRVSKVS
ncbi:hypothetical protein [Streptomyces sp. NPDC018031]|uniref:hypothetical protein n=1 Tax=Streptomyces sp. NPDC018031 TaxID=3365033 RepID=UPI0037BC9A1C